MIAKYDYYEGTFFKRVETYGTEFIKKLSSAFFRER